MILLRRNKRRGMKGACLLRLWIGTGVGLVAVAAAGTDMILYDDALQNGWANWGWADINYNQSSVVHSGSKAVRVVMNDGGAAVYLFHGAMDTRFYTHLSFWINGGPAGGQQLKLIARRNGVSQPAYALPNLPANTWQQMTVPLSDLHVSNVVDFSEMWIQNNSGAALPEFYFDDMKLVGAPEVTHLPVTITVDAAVERHPISPLIYGVNFGSTAALQELNATLNRSGGNAQTRYNWQDNCHNRAADWFFLSSSSGPAVPGEHADQHVQDSKNGGADPLITVPMIGRAPKLGDSRSSLYSFSVSKYGPQTAVDPWNADGGNGISAATGQPIVNDPDDANFPVGPDFQRGWIEHLTNSWGTAANGGVRYYCLDNEPSLWDNTHRDIYPVEPTMEELWSLYQEYGQMIKSVDPGALLIAPEDGAGHSFSDQESYGGGMEFLPWLLQQSAQFETDNGFRILDMLSVHYYPSTFFNDGTSVFKQRERNRNTRALWDPDYVDSTYARKTERLIPKLNEWVDGYYPGTPVGITEYNWGAENHINGAAAQADVWGIFGREGLDFATRWTTPEPGSMAYNAMKMYRNYDGAGAAFGDISVSASASVTEDDISVFAAERSGDGSLTVMVINKHLTAEASVDLVVAGFPVAASSEVWQLTASNRIASLGDVDVADGMFQAVLPAQSITLFVVGRAETGYAVWARKFGVSAAGMAGHSDSDGVDNLSEYLFGGDPTNSAWWGYVPRLTPSQTLVYVLADDPLAVSRILTSTNLIGGFDRTNTAYLGQEAFADGLLIYSNGVSTDHRELFLRLDVEYRP